MSHDPADNSDPLDQGSYSSTAPPAANWGGSTTNKGDGWKADPPNAPSQSRKVTLGTDSWGNRTGYLGPSKNWGDKGEYLDWNLETGVGHYSFSGQSDTSIDVAKHEGGWQPIDVQGQFSVVHGEGALNFRYQKFIKSFLGLSDDPKPPIVERVERTMMAARVSDMTSHWSPLFPGIGSTNVFIGGLPAWRANLDFHACSEPMDVGGAVLVGSPTVHINFMMACRMGDVVMEIPGGPNIIAAGCPTVLIGPKGEADFTEVTEPEEDSGGGLAIHVSGTSDFESVSCQANAGIFSKGDGVSGKVAGGCMAAVWKGTLNGSIELPLWFVSGIGALLFGDHTITVGVSGQATAGSVGVQGSAETGYSDAKGGYYGTLGVGAAAGYGGGIGIFGAIK